MPAASPEKSSTLILVNSANTTSTSAQLCYQLHMIYCITIQPCKNPKAYLHSSASGLSSQYWSRGSEVLFACFLSAALADNSSTYTFQQLHQCGATNLEQRAAAKMKLKVLAGVLRLHTSSQAVAHAPALPDSQVSLALSIAVSIADFCSLVCNATVQV